MAKRIPITDELKMAIKKSVGGDVNFDTLAIYEAIAVTSRPIVQRGLYSGATVERRSAPASLPPPRGRASR